FTSPPAQKPRPAPVSTTTPTAGSSARRGSASRSASSIGRDMAFRRSGRLRVSTATPSLTFSIRSVVIGAPLLGGAAAIVPRRPAGYAADQRCAGSPPPSPSPGCWPPRPPRPRSGPSRPTPSRWAGSAAPITCTCRRASTLPPRRWCWSSTEAAATAPPPSGSPASPRWPTAKASWSPSRTASATTGTTDARSRAHRDHVDDVAFVAALLDAVPRHHAIDPRRVYATGISNGGIFAHYLAAHLAGRLAAIAP